MAHAFLRRPSAAGAWDAYPLTLAVQAFIARGDAAETAAARRAGSGWLGECAAKVILAARCLRTRFGTRGEVDKAVLACVQAQMSSGRGGIEAIPHVSRTRIPLLRRLAPILAETAGSPPRGPPTRPRLKSLVPPHAKHAQHTPRIPTPPHARHARRQATSVASQTRPAYDESPGTTIGRRPTTRVASQT